MKILGWIRKGDKAACGGVVVEGCQTINSHGRELTYYGAHLACQKNCVIVQAHPFITLPNDQQVPHHGHITTNGCPLISTLNDIHGWTNENGEPVPLSFIQDDDGEWIGATFAEQTGHRFLVRDSETGQPLPNRKFVAMVGNTKQEGATDKNGYAHVDAEPDEPIHIHLIFAAPNGGLNHEGA